MIFTVKSIATLVMFGGLSLAGGAAWMANDSMIRFRALNTTVTHVDTTLVGVFTTNLPKGHVITAEDLTGVSFTSISVPPTRVMARDAIGTYARRDVAAGEPATALNLSAAHVDMEPLFIWIARGGERVYTCVLRCELIPQKGVRR